jgi:hypothetical protein
MDGNTATDTALLLPSDVATVNVEEPGGVPSGKLIVAEALDGLMTLILLTVPLPTVTVIGAPKRSPVSNTGRDAPAAANGGLMLVRAGSTLTEIV